VHIFNVRLGLATNSSSKHSLIFLPEGVEARDFNGETGEAFGDFGWGHFTAVSPQQKLRYLACMLKDRLYYELPANIADCVIKSWLGDVEYDPEDYIDHQSFMFIPSAHGSNFPDEQFTKELRDYLLQDRLAILGGNDNTQNQHPLHDSDYTFWLPVPTDASPGYSKYVCRYDEKYKYWTVFCREDGTKLRFRFDRSPTDMGVKPEKASTPELVDLKITDFCPYGCEYCYQASTSQGEHVRTYHITSLAEDLHLLKVFEVAIGGGEPTLHPDFPSILESFHNHGIVANFTTKNIGWMRDPRLVHRIMKACGAFGYSVQKEEEIRTLRTLLDYNGYGPEKVNIHVVLGVVDDWELGRILAVTGECGFNTTILSYKQVGRGANFQPKRFGNWLNTVQQASEGRNWKAKIGIDTPLAAEYQEQLQRLEVPDWLYDTKEGAFSCYIDLTKDQIGPSSYCKPEEMKSLKCEIPWGDPGWKEREEMIQDAFESF